MEAIRSLEEVKAWFTASGVTVRAWSKDHGFTPEQVYSVLSGRARGRYGASHAIALALRLKAPPKESGAAGGGSQVRLQPYVAPGDLK